MAECSPILRVNKFLRTHILGFGRIWKYNCFANHVTRREKASNKALPIYCKASAAHSASHSSFRNSSFCSPLFIHLLCTIALQLVGGMARKYDSREGARRGSELWLLFAYGHVQLQLSLLSLVSAVGTWDEQIGCLLLARFQVKGHGRLEKSMPT
jgi:hypothetical protein